MKEQTRYSMVLEWDPRDNIFVVTVPELPGCQTHGTTYEEAVKQGQEAIEGWIDAAHAWGDPVPSPRLYTDHVQEKGAHTMGRQVIVGP